MGFFRFRRSVKLLPGIRLNFGKKSTSLSFGVRGAHYTVGPHGSRTTVGLPGTGISYTSTSGTHRTPARMDSAAMEKALKWGAKQEETFHLEVPDKDPGEPRATQKQIDCIRALVRDIHGLDFDSLGTKQASAIIAAIKAEKDRFTKQKVEEYAGKRKRGCGCGCGTLLLIALAIFIIEFLAALIHSK